MFDFSLSCSDASSALFGLFDFSIAPSLLFYAYIPIIFVSIIFGLFVIVQDNYSLRSKLLFFISIIFSLLLVNEIVAWIAAPVTLVMFSWELVALFRILVPILTFYFLYVFIKKEDLPFAHKLFLGGIYALVLLLLPTSLNITAFDIYNCEAIPGILWNVTHAGGLLIALWIVATTFNATKKGAALSGDRQLNITVGAGATLFLLVFIGASMWGDVTQIYDVALVGPAGMLIFMALLTFSIVRFKAFNIKLAAPVALVFGLWAMIFSLLFVHEIGFVQIIVTATLLLLIVFGIALIKSVQREIAARERNEQLAKDLARVNSRLRELDRQKSEFVSIASHQLRSPLTAIRGYASMLLEGTYGKIPEKLTEPLQRINESSRFMALSIEDFLNVSRIEQGRMKYEFENVNVREVAEKVTDELRPIAFKKGLGLMFKTECEGGCVVNVDPGKIRQVIYNLTDNAIKYSEKGSITVRIRDDLKAKRFYVDVTDTGIGMSEETLHAIFDKFVRAKNANKVNVSGTGLGLYVARQMIEAMHGKITPSSPGEGRGSTFTIELPLA